MTELPYSEQISGLDNNENIDKSIVSCLEALLFVSANPLTPGQLAEAMELPILEIERGLQELQKIYLQENPKRGLRLQHLAGEYQLTTAPEAATFIERFLGMVENSRLSRASMETLAIVMYKQPVTRPQIDAIRGVDSETVLKSLFLKGLLQEVGRAETPGRPILYSVTPECLQYFGLSSLTELPPLDLEEP